MKYYSLRKVTEILGVTAQTLRNWDREGKLKPSYTKSNGYRYYSEDSILSYTQERKTKKELNVVGYARVSSNKQKDDLDRQVEKIYWLVMTIFHNIYNFSCFTKHGNRVFIWF